MGLKKGQTNNHKGRPAGVTNKVSTDLRTWLTSFLENERDQLQQDWKTLTPAQRITLWERLLKFCLPQLQSSELKTEFDKLTDEQLDHLLNKP